MASIVGPVTLSISDVPPNSVNVQVSYKIRQTHHDIAHAQRYHEVVELIGVDTLAGEDQADDIIHLEPPFWDGIVLFTDSQQEFQRIPERTLPAQALDEDPHPFLLRADEIRARVTLTPLPPDVLFKESNLVVRGGPVIEPTG
ncbi:MAG TPA: hypothetical protein VF468_28265 [Actinomycetota bacterium]|nr:hypothetical protein [Actinomycetota bacterium]